MFVLKNKNQITALISKIYQMTMHAVKHQSTVATETIQNKFFGTEHHCVIFWVKFGHRMATDL
jgi:hypothetical protein